MNLVTLIVTGVVAIGAAAVGGWIGTRGALKVSKEDNAAADARARAERVENRRKDAYLQIVVSVHTSVLAIRDQALGVSPSAEAVEKSLNARALSLFGSAEVRTLYQVVHDGLIALRNAIGGPLFAQRFREVQAAIVALEARIFTELSEPTVETA